MDTPSALHPHWQRLIEWLAAQGMQTDKIRVVARAAPGAGYGLFAAENLGPSTPLFTVPAPTLLNHLTLAPHYPAARPKLSCTQLVSLHLSLHRPLGQVSDDPLFGPFISVLPRDFDWHPLTWLRKAKTQGHGTPLETGLCESLPPRIVKKLDKIYATFKKDWRAVQKYLKSHPAICPIQTGLRVEDFLWGWLNVNTRCIYHRLAPTRSDPDNMTLCPILDFANHQTTIPTVLPEATQAELWNTGPLPKRNFGDNFTLLSPPVSVAAGQELFLKYGAHANSTLFVEYGFVNVANREASEEETGGEVEVDTHVEELFNQRGEIGSWMKDILTEEGYWGDWTIHATPAPAHPSYRLITTLRFYHLLRASANAVPANSGQHVQEWRNVTLGLQEMVSEENEHHWRMTLRDMCEYLATNAQRGRMKVSEICLDTQKEWLPSSILFIETLWREEMHVARSVIESLNNNADF